MLDKNLIESVIFCIILFIILYFSITYYNNRNHTYVKADDGNQYRVQITEDNKESANLLSDAITRVKTLLDHLKKSESQDIRTKTLLSRFNPNNITENDPQEMKGSKSINERLLILKYCAKIIFVSEWVRSRFFLDVGTVLSFAGELRCPRVVSDVQGDAVDPEGILYIDNNLSGVEPGDTKVSSTEERWCFW